MSVNILVVGATGITGSAFLHHCLNGPGLTTSDDTFNTRANSNHTQFVINPGSSSEPRDYPAPENWQFTGLTRNSLMHSAHPRLRCLQVDLLGDHSQLNSLNDITHLVFAGYLPDSDPTRQLERNTALLQNCLNALVDCPLEHIVLLQGMKYYGSHRGRFRTPAKEEDPRLNEPHYYYAQQDIVEACGVDWTCLRPHVICGSTSIGTPQNIVAVIGCYVSLCKATNRPVQWPGSEASYHALNQATDANLLAQAIVWSLQTSDARRQAFNVTNGDFFRWAHLWPKITAQFDA